MKIIKILSWTAGKYYTLFCCKFAYLYLWPSSLLAGLKWGPSSSLNVVKGSNSTWKLMTLLVINCTAQERAP